MSLHQSHEIWWGHSGGPVINMAQCEIHQFPSCLASSSWGIKENQPHWNGLQYDQILISFWTGSSTKKWWKTAGLCHSYWLYHCEPHLWFRVDHSPPPPLCLQISVLVLKGQLQRHTHSAYAVTSTIFTFWTVRRLWVCNSRIDTWDPSAYRVFANYACLLLLLVLCNFGIFHPTCWFRWIILTCLSPFLISMVGPPTLPAFSVRFGAAKIESSHS